MYVKNKLMVRINRCGNYYVNTGTSLLEVTYLEARRAFASSFLKTLIIPDTNVGETMKQ